MFYLLWWLLRAFSVDTWGSSFSKVSVSFVKRFLWLKCVWTEKSLQKIQTKFSFFDGPLFFFHSASFTWRLTTKSAPTFTRTAASANQIEIRALRAVSGLMGGAGGRDFLGQAPWVKSWDRKTWPDVTHTWRLKHLKAVIDPGENLHYKSLILITFEVKSNCLCYCDISTSAYIKSTL